MIAARSRPGRGGIARGVLARRAGPAGDGLANGPPGPVLRGPPGVRRSQRGAQQSAEHGLARNAAGCHRHGLARNTAQRQAWSGSKHGRCRARSGSKYGPALSTVRLEIPPGAKHGRLEAAPGPTGAVRSKHRPAPQARLEHRPAPQARSGSERSTALSTAGAARRGAARCGGAVRCGAVRVHRPRTEDIWHEAQAGVDEVPI